MPETPIATQTKPKRDARGRFLKGEGRWQKGQSGNPKGPPKKELSITLLLRQLMQNDPGEAIAVAEAWLRGAKAGQIEHLKMILRQFRELEPEGVDVTSKGEPIGKFVLRTADGDKTAKELKEISLKEENL